MNSPMGPAPRFNLLKYKSLIGIIGRVIMERNNKYRNGRAAIAGTIGIVIALAIVMVTLVGTGIIKWSEVVGFTDWLSRATAFGAAFAGVAALVAAGWAYRGVQETVRSAELREQETRQTVDTRERSHQEMVDVREREAARHDRFTSLVDQMASSKATVRMGGLFAISALADEWDREARRLAQKSPAADEWNNIQRSWQDAVGHRAQMSPHARERWAISGMPISESIEGLQKQRTEEVRESIIRARMRYVMTRDVAPLQSRDAVAQRDACIELVTAYIRSGATKGSHPAETETDELPPVDLSVLTVAVAIVRSHTLADANYPWPSHQINLQSADLRSANLQDVHLERANLRAACLKYANLEGVHFEGADLRNANFELANLAEANLNGADFNSAYLGMASLQGARLIKSNFVGAYLGFSVLEGADLSDADLLEADLSGADLSGADLSGANLSGADLSRANLRGAYLSAANLTDANVSDANFIGADLSGADLSGVDLTSVKLQGNDA